MATPLRPDEVPKDLICSVCLSVPLEPVIVSRCSHLFCQECISESVYHQKCCGQDESCPVCRRECTSDDLLPLEEESPLAHRIWSNINVKCEHHGEGCNWTGSILDYRSHECNCQKKKEEKKREDNDVIRSLKKENKELKVKNKLLSMKNQELEAKSRERNWMTVAKELEKLKSIVRRNISIPVKNGKGGYAYNRFNVVPLTKLICQNLEDIPECINPDKIFECVRRIGSDLRKDHEDNPEHFYIDARMLLSVCLASTWFTEKQLGRIREIAAENGWAQVV